MSITEKWGILGSCIPGTNAKNTRKKRAPEVAKYFWSSLFMDWFSKIRVYFSCFLFLKLKPKRETPASRERMPGLSSFSPVWGSQAGLCQVQSMQSCSRSCFGFCQCFLLIRQIIFCRGQSRLRALQVFSALFNICLNHTCLSKSCFHPVVLTNHKM